MPGFKAAGTPARYNKVGAIKVGPAKARTCWSWSLEHRPRVTDDTRAVGNGIANPAQKVLNVHSTMGRRLPRSLLIYAFGTVLGKRAVLLDAQALAKQSGIPMRNLTLVDRQNTYSHND